MSGPNPLDSPDAYLQEQYARQVRRIAADLRDLADTVEQRAAMPRSAGRGDLTQAAGLVLSAVTNALPNLALGAMVQAAADYDIYIATKPPEETP